MGRNARSNRPPVDMSVGQPVEDFASQFPPDELDEYRLDYELDDENRCIQRFRQWKGRTVWFALMQQTRVEEEWVDVARIDTCHNEAHIHQIRRKGGEARKPLAPIGSIDDVESQFDAACDMLLDHWDVELRRWSNER